MQLIPSMDLLGGRIVRLHQGDPTQATFYDLAPEAWIGELVAAGARRIHLVDLDGAFGKARQSSFAAFPSRWPAVQFQLGGGLRSRRAIEDLLAAGFDAVVGTLAVEQPSQLAGLPAERIIAALDLKEGRIATRGWTETTGCSSAEVFQALLSLGIRQALVTDVARDGSLAGPGLDSLRAVAAEGFQVQASGGLRHLEDLEACAAVAGVAGAISGKALLEGRIALDDPRTRAALEGA